VSSIDQSARSLEPGNLIELYEFDLSPQGAVSPDTPLYLHPYVNLDGSVLPFMGNEFEPFPIHTEGWDWSTKGTLPRPTVVIGNIDGIVTALLRQYNDFVACILTRRRTYAKFLDNGAEPGSAGNYKQYPTEVFSVERKVEETPTVVQFELTSAWDSEGIALPRRQILAGFCPWLYRGPECSYVGPPVADKEDHPIDATTDSDAWIPGTMYGPGSYVYVMVNGIRVYYTALVKTDANITDTTKWIRDDCSKRVSACKMRFGATNPLPFGGFPGAGKIPSGS
jgi:lambda family phage minor tail protein L